MGFLEGLVQTGKYYNLQDQAGELADIVNYLELPLDIPGEDTDPERRPQVIRVALKVADPEAVPLDVQGIESITLADYPGPFMKPEQQARYLYLYRQPAGKHVTWSFSPVHHFKDLRGEKDHGKVQKKFAKEINRIQKRILDDFEKPKDKSKPEFTAGSVKRILKAFHGSIDMIARLWNDPKRSYLLVLGLEKNNRFIHPGEIPAFITHFRKKLYEWLKVPSGDNYLNCVICQKPNVANRTLNKIFKFSTFDKPGFLPSMSDKNILSVFPVCEKCHGLLYRGYSEAEKRFSIEIGMNRVRIFIVPEIIGQMSNYDHLQKAFIDYANNGVRREKVLLRDITKRGAIYAFHFLFTEKNRAQVRLHRMVEDVPPSHFRKLFALWNWNRKRFFPERDDTQSLDSVIRQIVMMLQSLVGKTDGEKAVMRTQVINLIADLFANAYVEVDSLKRIAVSRLPGLVSDPDWLNAKRYSGGYQLERLWMLFEFLYAYNRHLDLEEVNV